MELYNLQKMIQEKNIPKVMVFYGEEYSIINLYIKMISNKLGLNINVINEVNSLTGAMTTFTSINLNKLYICRYSKEFMSKENIVERLRKTLGDSNYLIMVYSDIDKRGKLYKNYSDILVSFEKQDEKTLKTMLKSLHTMTDDRLEILLNGCELSYSRAIIELEKIKTFSQVKNISQNDAFDILLKDRTLYLTTNDDIFEFIDLVLKRKTSCYKLYNNLKSVGESNIKILSLLYTAFRNQIIVENVSVVSQETTGINNFFIYQCRGRIGNYSRKELISALKEIVKVEQGIKNGWIEEQISVDFLLSKVV